MGGPFLLPDGRHLGAVLRSSDADSVAGAEPQRRKSKSTRRGKDLQWAQVAYAHARVAAAASTSAHSAQELAELRALEAVGVRRRRRWLNDRLLRELAGPMSIADIERQFKPVPFGYRAASALELISQPEHSYVWDGFRNIDSDKEARVLQRWEQHNKEQAAADRGVVAPNAATQALNRWSRTSKKARMAFRKANIHTVLALESQVLDFLEGGDAPALQLVGLDGWGRLLVHGIADYWGLSSSSSQAGAATSALPVCKEEAEEGEAMEEVENEDGVQGKSFTSGPALGSGSGSVDEQEDVVQQAEAQPVITVWRRTQAYTPMPPPDITLTDIVMALREAGSGSLNASQLSNYIRKHVHGSESGRTDDWVVV